jgi:hypothetical protein
MTLPAESKLTLIELLEHVFYVLQVGSRHFGEFTKVTFPFVGLLCQNVTVVSMLPFDLTGTGFCKPFFGTGF